MIYHMILLMLIILIMQMNQFFVTSILIINIITTRFIPTIIFSTLKLYIVLWCKTSIYKMVSYIFTTSKILCFALVRKNILSVSCVIDHYQWIFIDHREIPLTFSCQNICAYKSSFAINIASVGHFSYVSRICIFIFCSCASFSRENGI